MDFSPIRTCHDLTEDTVAIASATLEDACALLDHLATMCEPHLGEENILYFLCRCAQQEWLAIAPMVEVWLGGMFECQIVLLRGSNDGAIEELKRVQLSASFLAFRTAAEDAVRIAPLRLAQTCATKLVFDTTAAPRSDAAAPLANAAADSVAEADPDASRALGRIKLERRVVAQRRSSRNVLADITEESLPLVRGSDPRADTPDAPHASTAIALAFSDAKQLAIPTIPVPSLEPPEAGPDAPSDDAASEPADAPWE